MAANADHDLTISLIPESARRNRGPVPTAAYVPIAVAIVGVLFILLGGIAARDDGDRAIATAPHSAIDATVTGAIPRR